jgi:glutaredoxin
MSCNAFRTDLIIATSWTRWGEVTATRGSHEREHCRGCFATAGPDATSAKIRMTTMPQTKSATLYRMVLPEHTCPFGVRAKQMLESNGFEVEDRVLTSRDEVDAFKEEQGVNTTPQVFIDGERIGGSDDLERYLAS